MFKCRFALVFMVVLVAYLQQSQGFHLAEKKDIKAPIVLAKVGFAKDAATKIKLAAFKKWAVTKAVIKAPFILGKKAALLKIGALKSLAAFKAAKAKKAFGFAAKKVAPITLAAAAIPAAAAAIPAAVAGIPAAAASLPAKLAALIPSKVLAAAPLPEVISAIAVPVHEVKYPVVQSVHAVSPNAEYGSAIVSTYNDKSDTPHTYANGYSVSLYPGGEASSSYQYYPIPNTSYGVVDTQHSHAAVKSEAAETEVIVPHSSYGVPN